jgi:hypothetical protein
MQWRYQKIWVFLVGVTTNKYYIYATRFVQKAQTGRTQSICVGTWHTLQSSTRMAIRLFSRRCVTVAWFLHIVFGNWACFLHQAKDVGERTELGPSGTASLLRWTLLSDVNARRWPGFILPIILWWFRHANHSGTLMEAVSMSPGRPCGKSVQHEVAKHPWPCFVPRAGTVTELRDASPCVRAWCGDSGSRLCCS